MIMYLILGIFAVMLFVVILQNYLPLKIRKAIISKQFESAITLAGVGIAVYAIIQVNEIDLRQSENETKDSLYKAKQFVLDSLQIVYIDKSKEFLSSIDTSSKSIDNNFSNISHNMENVPQQIDKVNELLNSLSRVTREHKNLIENQLKQRARLLLENRGTDGRGGFGITIVNRGEKIAKVTEIELEIKSGLTDEVLLNEFYREEYSQMKELSEGRFHFDFYREIPVTYDHHIGFTINYKGESSTDIVANIKIFYEWDGDKKGDVLTGILSSK